MLAKPFTTPEPPASNPTARAGWQAEKDLAFFLDRAFKADPAVHQYLDAASIADLAADQIGDLQMHLLPELSRLGATPPPGNRA